jgi:hypothetical protein
MTALAIAAIVAASLFTTGTVVKKENPQIGTTLQVAGIGTIIGGGLGTATGAAAALGTTGTAATVGTAATIGGSVGAPLGALWYRLKNAPGPTKK